MDPREQHLLDVVTSSLKRWLGRARGAVMAPWEHGRAMPDPVAIFATQDTWDREVGTIMTTIGQIAMDAWSQASDVPPVSRHAFVVSQLAQTENLLVAIPQETYNRIFAEITDGVNAGETVDAIAKRVDDVLSWDGSENWPGRARNIAMTETTRAYGAGTLAAGMEQSRVTGRLLQKQWDTRGDTHVRETHRAVDGEIRALTEPFMVGGFPMQMPGDVTAPPDEVCGCRCRLLIINEKGR